MLYLHKLKYVIISNYHQRLRKMVPNSKKYNFLSDNPLNTNKNDAFGHEDIVDVLVTIIQSCESPCNIGLYGQWGTGKTSILNLVKNKLNADNMKTEFDYVYLDAWKLSKENLRQQILIDLNLKYKKFTEKEIENMLYNIQEVKKDTNLDIVQNISDFFTDNVVSIVVFSYYFVILEVR